MRREFEDNQEIKNYLETRCAAQMERQRHTNSKEKNFVNTVGKDKRKKLIRH